MIFRPQKKKIWKNSKKKHSFYNINKKKKELKSWGEEKKIQLSKQYVEGLYNRQSYVACNMQQVFGLTSHSCIKAHMLTTGVFAFVSATQWAISPHAFVSISVGFMVACVNAVLCEGWAGGAEGGASITWMLFNNIDRQTTPPGNGLVSML